MTLQTMDFLDGVGGGGGGGGSNSFGIIASKMDGINFTGELPDIIFQKDENGLEAALILHNVNETLNKIEYAANTAGTNRILRFDNSATAGNMTNNGTWTLGSNSPGPVSVQHFIDTDKAAYLGGGGSSSSGGGFQSNQITKDNFTGDFVLPDALYVPLIRSGVLTLRPFYFNGFHGTTENAFAYIQYEWIIGQNERFTINFSNNTHGGFCQCHKF